ncbi:hypothetical protein IWW36_001678 [Coemansia brasiliensis]|uniref:G patch domain-containing protein n=1 Tax=Coemansia brasiliensis TaxID=2650707 RepID=A0A9W8IB39_9FUNG|nr:hypothetical protein IWW36_001678 [Coemansia brasiliensis]
MSKRKQTYDDDRPDFLYVGTECLSAQDEQRRKQRARRGIMDDKPKDYSRDAFKGGFSAGYFGTVGSKEGWKPSSFVSSRSNRASRQEPQKPVDFMDEEDMADLRASRIFAVRNEYKANALYGVAQVMANKPELYQRIGDQIMAAMGWRSGPTDGQMSKLIAKAAKPNYHGVGYGMDPSRLLPDKSGSAPAPSTSLPDLGNLFTRKPASKSKKKKKNVNVQQLSFGDMDDDVEIIPKAKAASKSNIPAADAQAKQPLSTVTSLTAADSRCHDGRLPLPGFVLVERVEPQMIEIAVPQSFTGIHRQPKTSEGSVPDPHLNTANDKPTIVTAEQRQKLGIMEPARSSSNHPPKPPVVLPNVNILSRFTAATHTADDGLVAEAKSSTQQAPSLKTVCRTVNEWVPSRLLCKRMNIAPPAQSLELAAENEPARQRKQAADYFNLNDNDYVWASDVQGSSVQNPQPRPDMKLLHSVFGSE